MRRHGKPQPYMHSAGVPLYGRIEESLDVGEIHDLVKLLVDFRFGHAQDVAVFDFEGVVAKGPEDGRGARFEVRGEEGSSCLVLGSSLHAPCSWYSWLWSLVSGLSTLRSIPAEEVSGVGEEEGVRCQGRAGERVASFWFRISSFSGCLVIPPGAVSKATAEVGLDGNRVLVGYEGIAIVA